MSDDPPGFGRRLEALQTRELLVNERCKNSPERLTAFANLGNIRWVLWRLAQRRVECLFTLETVL